METGQISTTTTVMIALNVYGFPAAPTPISYMQYATRFLEYLDMEVFAAGFLRILAPRPIRGPEHHKS